MDFQDLFLKMKKLNAKVCTYYATFVWNRRGNKKKYICFTIFVKKETQKAKSETNEIGFSRSWRQWIETVKEGMILLSIPFCIILTSS